MIADRQRIPTFASGSWETAHQSPMLVWPRNGTSTFVPSE